MSGAVRRPHSTAVHARLRLLMILIAILLSVFAGRLLQLQGVDPKAYAAQARSSGAVSVSLPATRGTIADRTGTALADSVDGRMIIADPLTTTKYAGLIASILVKRLGLDYFDTLAKLQKSGSRFQYLDRRVPSTLATEVVAQIQKAVQAEVTDPKLKGKPFPGISTQADTVRTYPAGDVGANLLGFLGDAGKPMAGLELSFDDWLKGRDGQETYEVGAGNRIPLGDNSTTQPVDGKKLSLTIDRDVQWYVQRVLRNAVQGSGGTSGSAVVMRTGTGEVLALADFPSYNANDPGSAKKGDLGSRALQDVYEPGSVEKVLTVSSLLDAHKVSPTTRITVPSVLPVADRVIHDWFQHPELNLTMTGVIAKSSNIGTALAAGQLTPDELATYLRSFGLGSRTDVGLRGESRGLLPDPSTWGSVGRSTIAFGQGLSVNALQMTTAINAVANGGVLVSPSLVLGSATDDAGTEIGTDHAKRHRVVSARAASAMAQMMEMVPNPETGTAPGAQVPGYRVAGKTGTAQRVGATCGCYDGTFTVSFAGFAPADKPEFTVYVVVQDPKNGGGGGSIGGPAFAKIQSFLLQRYGVAPSGSKPADLPITW